MPGQQLEGLGRHRDRAEPLGDDQREPHLLGPRDRHAQVVPEQLPKVLVMDAADDQGGDADLPGSLHGLDPEKRAASDDLVLHGGKQLGRGQGLLR